jgi:hypothetical protein
MFFGVLKKRVTKAIFGRETLLRVFVQAFAHKVSE